MSNVASAPSMACLARRRLDDVSQTPHSDCKRLEIGLKHTFDDRFATLGASRARYFYGRG